MNGFNQPFHFSRIPSMVSTHRTIEFARTGSEMGNDTTPTTSNDCVHQCQCIVTLGTTFQSMDVQHHRSRVLGSLRFRPIYVHKVPVRRIPSLTTIVDLGTFADFRRNDRLQMRPSYPTRCFVVRRDNRHQLFSTLMEGIFKDMSLAVLAIAAAAFMAMSR